jgi:hypothetical protein
MNSSKEDLSSIATTAFSDYVKCLNHEFDNGVTVDNHYVIRRIQCVPVSVYRLMTDVDRLCADIRKQFYPMDGGEWRAAEAHVGPTTGDSVSANFDVGLSIEVAIVEELAADVTDDKN